MTALDPGETSPYAVYFNVKCPTKNAVGGKYAANYAREFEKLLNNKSYSYTYSDIVSQGYAFTADEIALINSDEGYTMAISTVPDEITRAGTADFGKTGMCQRLHDGVSFLAEDNCGARLLAHGACQLGIILAFSLPAQDDDFRPVNTAERRHRRGDIRSL